MNAVRATGACPPDQPLRCASESRQLGQTLVEFALILTMFLMLLMGIVDLGRGVMAQNSLSHAAREGARRGIYAETTDAQIRQAVRAQEGLAVGLTDGQIDVVPTGSRQPGSVVTVTVRYTFTAVTPMMNAFIPGGLQLSASAQSVVQ